MIRIVHILRETARLMIGLPDYDRYCRHVRQTHPDREPMTRAAFFRDRQQRRYGSAGGKCC
nr:YbdD/YjiX family protein [Sphingomonas sp. Y57]